MPLKITDSLHCHFATSLISLLSMPLPSFFPRAVSLHRLSIARILPCQMPSPNRQPHLFLLPQIDPTQTLAPPSSNPTHKRRVGLLHSPITDERAFDPSSSINAPYSRLHRHNSSDRRWLVACLLLHTPCRCKSVPTAQMTMT